MKRRFANWTQRPDPPERETDDRWYDWSPLDPPDWVFEARPGYRTLGDRLEVHFADWWQPPGRHNDWVRIPQFFEDDVLAWWDRGDSRARPPRPPRIELHGTPPPASGVPEFLPGPVDQIGWWIVANIPMAEARRWVQAGMTYAPSNRLWAKLLGEDIQVRFPGSKLATRHHGRWVPTDDGFRVLGRLNDMGFREREFRGGRARHWASAAGGSLDRGLELLQEWVALTQQGLHDRLNRPSEQALRWLTYAIDIEEARQWIRSAHMDVHEAWDWRKAGFTPSGAALWKAEGQSVSPSRVRQLHLQLHGETRGLGPERNYKPYKWKAPRTRTEKIDHLVERCDEKWAVLTWKLRGRPM